MPKVAGDNAEDDLDDGRRDSQFDPEDRADENHRKGEGGQSRSFIQTLLQFAQGLDAGSYHESVVEAISRRVPAVWVWASLIAPDKATLRRTARATSAATSLTLHPEQRMLIAAFDHGHWSPGAEDGTGSVGVYPAGS